MAKAATRKSGASRARAAAKKKASGRKAPGRKPAARKKPVASAKSARSAKKTSAKKKAVVRKAAAGKAPARKPAAAAKAKPARPAKESKAPAPVAGKKPAARRTRSRRASRRVAAPRRGPDGELLAPGELLLPGGPKSEEEIHYLLRGCVAGEVAAGEIGVEEILGKQASPDDPQKRRGSLESQVKALSERFGSGAIEPNLPARSAPKQTFDGVVDRARQRRREIGAFLRGLDLAQTETSHMDSHGEASLQNVMEWAARLEKLIEAEEPEQGDYEQFHRGMDQLDHTTESLIVDVELTLRRLGSRAGSR